MCAYNVKTLLWQNNGQYRVLHIKQADVFCDFSEAIVAGIVSKHGSIMIKADRTLDSYTEHIH